MNDNKNKEQNNRNDAISVFMQDEPAQDKGALGQVRDASLSLFGDGVVGAGEAFVASR